ncbi:ABC transporter permease [Pedobacter suwonensis]
MFSFFNSFQSEWLKTRRSLASWLVVCGAFFTPLILTVVRTVHYQGLSKAIHTAKYWQMHWKNCWESVAVFLLPLGAILASSLITQIEYKNNSWKLLHTSPQQFSVIFFAKFSVILLMMLLFLFLFNLGIYLSGIFPPLLRGIGYPDAKIDSSYFLKENLNYLIGCMPIISLQYLISLQFKNFLVPVGSGIILWILSIGMLSWKFAYWLPYGYLAMNFLRDKRNFAPGVSFNSFSLGYFTLFLLLAYILYIQKKDKS